MFTGPPQTMKRENPGSLDANYIFVTATTDGKTRNNTQRRSHVMYNLSKKKAQTRSSNQDSPPRRLSSVAAGKCSFRVAHTGLGRYPSLEGDTPPPAAATGLKQTPSVKTLGSKQDASSEEEPIQPIVMQPENLSANEVQTLLRLSTSPLLMFGISRIDPLGVLPVKLSPWDEVLVDRFCHYKKWPWCPVSGQTLWSPFALSDELAFSATMYSWSMGFGGRLKGLEASSWFQNNPGVMQHRLSTITLINTRISNPEEAIKDQTVAAVAIMTNLELLFGTKNTAIQHMNALKTIIAMRGGFSTFTSGFQQLLYRLVSWIDIFYAESFGTSPSFSHAEIWDVSWNNFDQLSLPGSPLGLSPSILQAEGIPHHEVLDAMKDVYQLCGLERTKPLATLEESERMQRADTFMKIERRLAVVVQSTNTLIGDDHNRTMVWRATALAMLMFVHHFLRGNPLRHRQFGALASALQQTLSQMDHNLSQLAFARSLLFWILSVGSVASVNLSCHLWFLQKLADVCELYSMKWANLRSLLIGFLWTGPADEERFLNVWKLVEYHKMVQLHNSQEKPLSKEFHSMNGLLSETHEYLGA